ncbi:MAG: hypothetical protein KKE93_02335 [Nanoarchaeota archaeon]|nr:hypothetical protein [Nanoarchaeota archaeon]
MAAEQATTATVTVDAFLSVTFTNYPVTFPNMNPGTTQNAGASNGYPLTVTIDSVSNVNAIVKTKADAANFLGTTNASLTFPVSNMEWSITAGGTYADYLTTDATVCASVAPTSACNIYHKLTIPSAQKAGSYSVGITITATQV